MMMLSLATPIIVASLTTISTYQIPSQEKSSIKNFEWNGNKRSQFRLSRSKVNEISQMSQWHDILLKLDDIFRAIYKCITMLPK